MDYSSKYLLRKLSLGGGRRNRIGSLSSHIGMLDDDLEELLAAGKLRKIWSWYNKMGLRLQKHRDHSITCIDFDEAFNNFQWAHLPRHHIIGEIPVLFGFAVHVLAGWRYQAEKGLAWMQDIDLVSSLSRGWYMFYIWIGVENNGWFSKISWYGLQWGRVEYKIRK